MIDLDQELSDLGAQWRAAQPAPSVSVKAPVVSRWRRKALLAIAAVMVGAALVVGVTLVATRDQSTRSVRIRPQITPTTSGVPPTVAPPTEAAPGVIDFSSSTTIIQKLAAHDGTLWLTGNTPNGTHAQAPLFALDANTGHVLKSFQMPLDAPFALNATSKAVWIRGEAQGATYLLKVDNDTGAVIGTRQLTLDAGLAVTDTAVWALDNDQLLRIDPDTLKTTATIPLPGGPYPPLFITAGPHGIWLASPYDGNVSHVNPATNAIDSTTHAGDHLSTMVELDGSLWVLNETELVQIDAATRTVARRIPLQRRAYDLTTNGTYLYAATIGPDTAQQVDLTTGTVTSLAVSPSIKSATNIAYDPASHTLWVGGGVQIAHTIPKQ
jgi:hypothetical protein